MTEDNQPTNRNKMSRRIFLGVGAAAAVGAIFRLKHTPEIVEAENETHQRYSNCAILR